MHPAAGDGVAGIVGRESELKVLADFVTPTASGAALVLRGGPGVGKTTLWQAGRDAALGHGIRVISARPNSAETSLSFVSLADLLDGIEPEALDALPAPQRRGLEVALLRADPDGEAAAPRAMAFGLLNLFRQLAASRPLLVAVDDLQWLDQPTAEMLAFAVRRLHGPSVRFLFAARAGPSSAVERAFAPAGPQILEVRPLSVGAMRRMLSDRLGLALPRYVLRQVTTPPWAIRSSRWRSGGRWPSAGCPRSGRTFRCPTQWRNCSGSVCHGWRARSARCCWPWR